jgi:hypothetical protein
MPNGNNTMPPNNNGWEKWSNYVIAELKRIGNTQEYMKEKQDSMNNTVTELRISVAKLDTQFKVKSSIWGLIGGALPIIIILGIWLIKGL